MPVRLCIAVAVGAAAAAAALMPAAASAQWLSLPAPLAGDGGTAFSFSGRGWEPRGPITAQYFRRASDARPWRQRRFGVGESGRFAFRLVDPWFDETGVTQRLCFVQAVDGRTLRRCQRFYVAPPSAYFMPADGLTGAPSVLVASGFGAGRTLTIELQRPDGVRERYRMRTRTRPGFVADAATGPIFVPRGGAFRRFEWSSSEPPGLYTAYVWESDMRARARAAVMVRAGR
jgi:hypothetical protein